MTTRVEHSRHMTQILGAIGLTAIVVVSSLLVATYLKAFKDVVHVTVEADRAGLLLDEGSRVRLSGVAVGEVRGTTLRPDGRVEIDLALDEDKADLVPSDVTASIRGTTVFGSKFIDLRAPEGTAAPDPIAAGAVINADGVTIEVNDVFDRGVQVLQAVDPADINSTLTSVSTALRGRGDDLGQFFTDWNTYFGRLEPHLDALEYVLETSPAVLGTYAAATPELIATADNLATTSSTLVRNADQFEALLSEAISGADSATRFLRATEAPLRAFNKQWLPVTRLGERYSPELGCLIRSLDQHRQIFSKFFGSESENEHYFYAKTGFLPGQEAYSFPKHAPKVMTGVGPACYPEPTAENPTPPRVRFDDGSLGVYSDEETGRPVSPGPIALYDDMLADWLGEGGRGALLEGIIP